MRWLTMCNTNSTIVILGTKFRMSLSVKTRLIGAWLNSHHPKSAALAMGQLHYDSHALPKNRDGQTDESR